MLDILPSGLSVGIAYLISGGMHCRDPYENAQQRLFELYELPAGWILTVQDAEAVRDRLAYAIPFLGDDGARLQNYLLTTHPVYRLWCDNQDLPRFELIAAE